MLCVRVALIGSLLALLAGVTHGDEAKTPHTDLYGDPLPPGAVMRLGTIRLRHADADVVFSKDGKQLISCGRDGEVRVWDVATGKLRQRTRLACKPAEDSWVDAPPILSPSGTLALVRRKNTVCLCDTKTGAERGQLPDDFFGDCSDLVFSPNEKSLAALRFDNKGRRQQLLIWNMKQNQKPLIVPWPREVRQLKAMAFTSDGRRLAGLTGNAKDNLCLRDAANGKETIKTTVEDATALAWTPDGKTLAVAAMFSGDIHLLDGDTLRERRTVKAPDGRKAHWKVERLAFSPDGRLLAGTYANLNTPLQDDAIHLWNAETGQEIQQLPQGHASCFAFAPDGKTLVFWSIFGSALRLWDVVQKREVHPKLGAACPGMIRAVSPDGKQLACGDFDVRLWDVADGRLRSRKKTPTAIRYCFFSPDGTRLITLAVDGTVQVWDSALGKELHRFALGFSLMVRPCTVGLAKAGRHLLLVQAPSPTWGKEPPTTDLSIWDLASGKRLVQRPYRLETRKWESFGGTYGVVHAAFSPDGTWMTEWREDRVGLVELTSEAPLASLPSDVGDPLVFSHDSRLLAAAIVRPSTANSWKDMKGVAMLETVSGEEIFRKTIAEMQLFTFAPEGRLLIEVDKQGLWAWDTDTGEPFYRHKWPEGVSAVHSLAALPGGRVATGLADGDILIWELPKSSAPPTAPKRKRQVSASLWTDLADDARTAYPAMHTLTASPTQSVTFFQEHLRATDGKRFEKLLADLDSDSFETRETASQELKRMYYRAEPMLRQALENKPSLEMRRRIEPILTEPRLPQADDLRMLRAIAVLERIGTPEARRILEKLAAGAMSPERREAQAALQRLKRRDASANGRSSP